MADAVIFDAIKDYLTTTWDTTPIRFENENFEPVVDVAWVDVEMTGNFYGQMTIGASEQEDNRWDEEGVLWLHVLVPQGTGGHTVRDYAKQLADLFRGKTLLNNSLEFRDAFIGRGVPGIENGNWYRVSVYINWRRMEA